MATKKETESAAIEAAEVKETETESNTKVKQAAKSPAVKKAKDEGCRFCVYLGPSIRGAIQHGAILNGTRDEALASIAPVVEKYRLAASLVVTDETIAEDRVKVKTPGNLLYVNYRKLSGKKA